MVYTTLFFRMVLWCARNGALLEKAKKLILKPKLREYVF
jgi:hypothetical protein